MKKEIGSSARHFKSAVQPLMCGHITSWCSGICYILGMIPKPYSNSILHSTFLFRPSTLQRLWISSLVSRHWGHSIRIASKTSINYASGSQTQFNLQRPHGLHIKTLYCSCSYDSCGILRTCNAIDSKSRSCRQFAWLLVNYGTGLPGGHCVRLQVISHRPTIVSHFWLALFIKTRDYFQQPRMYCRVYQGTGCQI
jgi:hypothetical protein